jgi:hypothetical protein
MAVASASVAGSGAGVKGAARRSVIGDVGRPPMPPGAMPMLGAKGGMSAAEGLRVVLGEPAELAERSKEMEPAGLRACCVNCRPVCVMSLHAAGCHAGLSAPHAWWSRCKHKQHMCVALHSSTVAMRPAHGRDPVHRQRRQKGTRLQASRTADVSGTAAQRTVRCIFGWAAARGGAVPERCHPRGVI